MVAAICRNECVLSARAAFFASFRQRLSRRSKCLVVKCRRGSTTLTGRSAERESEHPPSHQGASVHAELQRGDEAMEATPEKSIFL